MPHVSSLRVCYKTAITAERHTICVSSDQTWKGRGCPEPRGGQQEPVKGSLWAARTGRSERPLDQLSSVSGGVGWGVGCDSKLEVNHAHTQTHKCIQTYCRSFLLFRHFHTHLEREKLRKYKYILNFFVSFAYYYFTLFLIKEEHFNILSATFKLEYLY